MTGGDPTDVGFVIKRLEGIRAEIPTIFGSQLAQTGYGFADVEGAGAVVGGLERGR